MVDWPVPQKNHRMLTKRQNLVKGYFFRSFSQSASLVAAQIEPITEELTLAKPGSHRSSRPAPKKENGEGTDFPVPG